MGRLKRWRYSMTGSFGLADQLQRIDLSYYRINLRHTDSQVKLLQGDQLVWWYGPIRQNTRPRSIPLVKVHFRQLFNDVPGPRTSAIVPLSSLPHYRIGTIWRNGLCVSDTNLASAPEDFEVNFDEDGWSLTSRAELVRENNSHLFHHDEYALQYQHDRTRLLNFKLANGRKICSSRARSTSSVPTRGTWRFAAP